MTSYRVLTASLALLALAGCASVPYAPPQSGPTAKLDVSVHNTFGPAELDVGMAPLSQGKLVTATTVGQMVTTSTIIGADRPVWITYGETSGQARCNLGFHFSAAPDRTYDLFVGDISPKAATTDLGKFGQWLFPLAGKGCFAKVWQEHPGGSLAEMPMPH